MIISIAGQEYAHEETVFADWEVCHGCGKPFPAEELHDERAPGDVMPEKYCMECPIAWRGPLTEPFTRWHVEKTRKELEALRESKDMPDTA